MIIVKSPVFKNGGTIPREFTCDGNNFSPPLVFDGIPHISKSLVIIVDDPDAPNGTWTHWVVFNVDPSTIRIEKNKLPKNGVKGANDFHVLDYRGPCPPNGTHRYFFRVYALDTLLTVAEGMSRGAVEHSMQGHILDQGELMGTYTKQP